MAIIVACASVGLDAGYARINRMGFVYPIEGEASAEALIQIYVSQEARESGLEPVQQAFIVVPLTVFNGAYSDLGAYPNADVRETFYSYLRDPNRGITAGEEVAGIDFRNGVDA